MCKVCGKGFVGARRRWLEMGGRCWGYERGHRGEGGEDRRGVRRRMGGMGMGMGMCMTMRFMKHKRVLRGRGICMVVAPLIGAKQPYTSRSSDAVDAAGAREQEAMNDLQD
jgi:hypothetical protein